MSESDKTDRELDAWLSTLAGEEASREPSAFLLRSAMLAAADEKLDAESERSLAAIRVKLADTARALPDTTLQTRRSLRNLAAERLRAGQYIEPITLKAAADPELLERLPRLRTSDGFVLTPLYPVDMPTTGAATGLLVECPDDLLDMFSGCAAALKVGDRVVALGVFSANGKLIAELPADLELRPPLSFVVLPA